jgi:hypothetical protein
LAGRAASVSAFSGEKGEALCAQDWSKQAIRGAVEAKKYFPESDGGPREKIFSSAF